MGNLVIAAIPDENDRVWKISSEKIPHLTVLFLGETDKVANLEQLILFVEHAANTSLRRFYLPVDRRGELGADQADVLFFKKGRYDYKAIRDFRAALLQDSNIKTAYDSTTQFDGVWQPHLTLGYPATPAKPMPDDQMSTFYDVSFNKIAVWTDDFDGPDFLLKDYWDEYEALETVPMDVAMSDIQHVGVKGMKWGVRKEDVDRAASSSKSAVGKAARDISRFAGDIQFESRTRRHVDPETGVETTISKAQELVVNAAHKEFKSKDLTAINAKPEYQKAKKLRNRLLKPFDKTTKAYRAEVKQAYINRLETTANSMKNPSGTREYSIRERGGDLPKSKYYWEVSTREARHAEGRDFTLVEVLTDEDGFITGTKIAEDSMAQTIDLGAAFLEHHGVKGMRWGVRNVKKGAVGVAKLADNAFFEVGTQNRYVAQGIAADASNRMKKQDLPALKAKHGAAGKRINRLKSPLSAEAKAYRKDAKAAYLNRLEESANARTNFQGSRRYTLNESGKPNTSKYFWTIKTEKIQHAAGDEDEFMVHPIFDDEGFIIDLAIQPFAGEMAQSAIDSEEFLLEHFGVKGMRWGVRREGEVSAQTHIDTGLLRRRTQITTKGGESQPAHVDAVRAAVAKQKLKKSGHAALSTQELRDLANRLQVEQQVSQLMSSKGQKFVSQEIEKETKRFVKKSAKRAGPRVVKKAGKAAATAATIAVL